MEDNHQKIIEIGDYRGNLLEHKALFDLIVEDIDKWEENEDYSIEPMVHYGTCIEISEESPILTWWEESPHKQLLEELDTASRASMKAGFFGFVQEFMGPGSQVGSGDNPLQTIERNQWLEENADTPDASQGFSVPEELRERLSKRGKEIVRIELEEWVEQNQGVSYSSGKYMVGAVQENFYELAHKWGFVHRDKTDGYAGILEPEEGTIQKLQWWLLLLFSGNLIEDVEDFDNIPAMIITRLHSWGEEFNTKQPDVLKWLHANRQAVFYRQQTEKFYKGAADHLQMIGSDLSLSRQKKFITDKLSGDLVLKGKEPVIHRLQLQGRYTALLMSVHNLSINFRSEK